MSNISSEQIDDMQLSGQSVPTVSLLPGILFNSPFEFLSKIVAEHGDFIRLKVGPWSFYLLSNPDHFRIVLRDKIRNYKKSDPIYEPGRVITGNGLITSDGDFWLRQRRMMQPYFHRKRIAAFADVMTDAIEVALDSWLPTGSDSHNIKLIESITQVTVQVTTKVMFGANTLSAEEIAKLSKDQAFILEQVAMLTYLMFLPHWIPRPGAKRFAQVVDNMKNRVQEIIKLGRNDKDADTLLAMLIRAVDEDTNEQMTDEQLYDEIQSIFSAGFETTAKGLVWTMYLLDKNPDVREKLLQEIEEAVGKRKPTFEDLRNLPYCKMVIEEALRYYPPVVALPRTAIEDDVLGEEPIPAGKIVILFYYGLHHNPKFWDNPEQFNPERFNKENTEARDNFAYLPFAAGPRKCIGNEFARMESVFALVMILQRYHLKLVDNTKVTPQIATTLSPKDEIDAIITKL